MYQEFLLTLFLQLILNKLHIHRMSVVVDRSLKVIFKFI